MQKDGAIGTLCFFKKSFCGTHNKEVIEGITEFIFKDLVIEEIQINSKVVPLALMLYGLTDYIYTAYGAMRVYWLVLGICVKGAELDGSIKKINTWD